MKKWIKFAQDHLQKSKAGDSEASTEFKKGQVIELDANIVDSLITLGIAEESSEPSADDVVKKTGEKFLDSVTQIVEKAVSGTFENLTKSYPMPAVAKDHELEKSHGFVDEGEFVSALIKAKGHSSGDDVDARLLKAPLGQNTLDDTEGGFLIPETFSSKILEINRDAEELDIFSLAGDKQATSGNNMRSLRMAETSRKDGFGRHGGMVAYWRGEAEEFTASTIKWGERKMELHKLTALAYVTDEELQDSSVALGNSFTTKARQAILWKRNKAMFDGTGAGMPLGVFNSTATITAAKTVAAGSMSHVDLNLMYHTMLPGSRASAVWYAHPNVISKLSLVNFNDTDPEKAIESIYMPPGGISASPYGSLYGRPVVPTEFCKDLNTVGDIAFVDFGQYSTLVKSGSGAGVQRATSIHVRFVYEETAFRFSYRCDARPLWSSAIEDLNGTTTRSPYVVLTTRT